MPATLRTRWSAAAAVLMLTLGAAACAPTTEPTAPEAGTATTVTVEDNFGSQTVATPPQRVVVTDNRLYETLDAWDIELVGASRRLMPPTVSYKDDESIVDLGLHSEPDLEAIVAADPDLILNGQRFAQYREDFAGLVPDATIIEVDPRDGQPFDEELRRQVTTLGTVFQREAEAQQIVDDFNASIERVKAAYRPDAKVMAVLTSGGEISYVAPSTGRTLGPAFDILGLTPALEVAGEDTSHGDDISVEAIAQANPDWLLVMDRDAGTSGGGSGEEYTPANELLSGSAALQNVTAVKNQQIVYMPEDSYLNEGIQTYTEFFNALADAMERSV